MSSKSTLYLHDQKVDPSLTIQDSWHIYEMEVGPLNDKHLQLFLEQNGKFADYGDDGRAPLHPEVLDKIAALHNAGAFRHQKKLSFMERVVQEKVELDEKLSKLTAFINSSSAFAGLPSEERQRLVSQRKIMSDYADVLHERITSFNYLNNKD